MAAVPARGIRFSTTSAKNMHHSTASSIDAVVALPDITLTTYLDNSIGRTTGFASFVPRYSVE